MAEEGGRTVRSERNCNQNVFYKKKSIFNNRLKIKLKKRNHKEILRYMIIIQQLIGIIWRGVSFETTQEIKLWKENVLFPDYINESKV